MKVGIFGGSFDPIHEEHIEYVAAAHTALGLDRVIVVPSFVAPHKQGGAVASGKERLAMCCLAFENFDFVEVSDYELAAGGTSYTYLTCRHFRAAFPDAELFFLVGADMLEDFFTWRNPEDILKNVTLAACGREGKIPAQLHARFVARFGQDFIEVPFTGAAVSSTDIRVALAFGKNPAHVPPRVLQYIDNRKIYRDERIMRALALEKPPRQEHSFRVAKLACRRARSLGIPEGQAMLAAGLHDCAKNLPLNSVLLAGFVPPEGVPEPVMHQYAGAYLAEHLIGVPDAQILDAIRFHASGREDMTPLGKLIYLADLLEEDRRFEGVEELRSLFWKDLDVCLCVALERQLAYLRSSGQSVYELTEKAYKWLK